MLPGIESRAFNALRDAIQQERENYTSDLECVGVWDQFVGHRERFRTLKEVLDMMDEIEKALSE